MKYLKQFATPAAYEAAASSLIAPNVSLITDGSGKVMYMKETPTPPTPTHEYVDLGLPSGTLWATMNLGANSITDTGLYYQWGDTQGYTYNEREWEDSTYKWYDAENDDYSKYNSTDGKLVLDNSDDAAIAAWGDGWHIPTKAQCVELINEDYVTTAWTTDYQGSGVKGLLITSKENGNTLFLPANTEIGTEYERAVYQSNATFDQYGKYSWFITIYSERYGPDITDENCEGEVYRAYGNGIRPVKDGQQY